MPSYDNWRTNDEDGDNRHDYFIEAKCDFCGKWAVCIPMGDEFIYYICEQCDMKAEEER